MKKKKNWRVMNFNIRAKDADYFLVTSMSELNLQPLLAQNLARYSSIQGDGYILYNLHKPNSA